MRIEDLVTPGIIPSGQRLRGEVDDEFDIVALQQLVDAHRRQAEFRAALLGCVRAHVGHGPNLDIGEVLSGREIGSADIAASDDADADRAHETLPCLVR